jgi:hypothetical protein
MKRTIRLIIILAITTCTGIYAQNNALNFDGINDYVSVAGIQNPSGSFTAEAWARMETYGMRTVFSKIGNGWVGFTISYDAPNNRMGADMGAGTSWPNVLSFLPWNLNQWYHVALVYDAAIDTMYFYQDGVLQGSVFVVPVYSTTLFKIGNDDWFELWDGDIDEVRLWNIARTQANIQSTMFMELTGAEQGLTNYYKFNEGIPGGNNTGIGPLIDSKGNANGTFVDFALNGNTSNFVGSAILGINKLVSKNLTIYPNPVVNELIIESTGNNEGLNFEILNSLGQVMFMGRFFEKEVVPISHFSTGMYIVKIKSGLATEYFKILKD